jgi:hypothetical protein
VPLSLDATVGGPASNAYQDVAAVTAILAGVPNADAWTAAASVTDRQPMLAVHATTLLEAIAYQGVKYTVGQALNWPRGGVIDPDYGQASGAIAGYMVGGGRWGVYLDFARIPRRILRAHAMLALEVARAGAGDVWNVDADANKAAKTVDVLSTTFIDPARRRYGLQVYRAVWREIAPLTLAAMPRTVERA